MRIAYRLVQGLARDLRFVAEDYVAQVGEAVLDGDELPSIESLSEPSALAGQERERETERLRAAAWVELQDKLLADAAASPGASQAIRDYAAAARRAR